MKIIKRDGNHVDFDLNKIVRAMEKAFSSVNKIVEKEELEKMAKVVEETVSNKYPKGHIVTVEEIQDLVELTLIDNSYYAVVKSYILYRAQHSMDRKVVEQFEDFISDQDILNIIKSIQDDYDRTRYEIEQLYIKFTSFVKKGMNDRDYLKVLIRAASELTSKEAPDWEYISARFYCYELETQIEEECVRYDIQDFKTKIKFLEEQGLYGPYIRENYSNDDIDELEKVIDKSRNKLFTYSSIELVSKRYLIKTHDNKIMETPQEMFMGIAMHLAIPEGKNKVEWAKRFYDVYSNLQVTVATPTMSNARKPFHQLSSCFIDTVPDSLDGIYRSIDNFAQVSKHGGGMGMYFGKVRATGSDIRGFKGVAGGIVRWIKLANDTAVAVDQLGVRQGSVAVYLDVWHKDIPEFLQLRTNNGDDRLKAHDVFPAVCYPDLFWKLAKNDINADWYLMDPHEIMVVKGWCLEDSYGEDWEEKYWDCVNDSRIDKRVISVKDLVRLIIKSLTETGTPFAFNRDTVNKMNPNKHKGIIYSSNLCTEILQNMSEIETVSQEIEDENGDTIVVTKTKAGDFVVCNLASLVLGNIDINNQEELQYIVETAVRGLDNVIDLNYYPIPYARITNKKYRSIGLGTSGYHHALVKEGIMWSDIEEHVQFADRLYEDINYYAIEASMKISKEKGSYEFFEGSEWQSGEYFTRRSYISEKWEQLEEDIQKNGLRNGYIMAVAPTGSTSIIAGTTAAVDPVMNRYFLEEKKGSIVPRVAPGLNPKTFWTYENAHEIDQTHVVRAAGVRQRHIDQGQSINLYITTEFTMRMILNLYVKAWENGVKTIYYVRSKSLEVEECDSCSA
ncbi:ribonucleoside-diphosphate reductase subunit alpha [Miniphocaeibacter massiliensis]|uniref:ribonucleoside-diphosphate reductase subunit alpha n=1 Tax=Miniphocaeibacter massiliensis TaxID=2041841 RepID=UPI000C1C0847|nr:ribonucleoside-diphosphate reductase subunit alpha [Miniphocaeibacter massiliensis]